MIKKIFIVFISLFISLVIISCSDDDSNPTGPEGNQAKELSLKEIQPPAAMQQSSNPHAQAAVMWLNLANSFKSYSAFYTPQDNLNKLFKTNDEWTSTWMVDALQITMDYFEDALSYGWQIFLNGTDGEFTYADWLYMEAEQNIDDSYGQLKVYKPVTTEVAMQWDWSTAASSGIYYFNLFILDNTSEKLEIVSNPDNSGEISYYSDQILQTKISWTNAGTGYFWEYDESGNVIDEGPF